MNPVDGFNQTITVTISGLPAGVTSVPASPFSMNNAGQVVTLSAAPSATQGTATLSFNATSGSRNSPATVFLSVTSGPPGLPNNRSDFVRLDDTPLAVVFDSVHHLIFASAFHRNCVAVINPATVQEVICIPVSGALGLSLSADGSQVLVGTQVGEVAWIDTTSLQVVRRDTIPQTPQAPDSNQGNNYVVAAQAYQAANGKVLMFSNWGYSDLYGNLKPASVVEWDPAAGTSVERPDSGSGGLVSVSADHTKILIAGEGIPTLYDSANDSFTTVPGTRGVGYRPAMNPAGTQFALVDGSPLVQFFDSHMSPVGTADACCGGLTATYSSDGKFLYVSQLYAAPPNGIPSLLTIDATTFQVVGTAPAYFSQLAYFSAPAIVGHAQAADAGGLVFDIADHGVAFDDSANLQDLTKQNGLGLFIVATPDEGPQGSGTTTQFESATFSSLPDVFFGTQRAGNENFYNGANQLEATAPPAAKVGPVNVKATEADGPMVIMPQGFTYGSTLLQYGILASSPDGNVAADFFGYGLSADLPNANTQVTIGSTSGSLLDKRLFPTEFPYPFPLQHLTVSVPAGRAGARDVVVSSPAGQAVYPGGFHYLASVVDYPSADSFQYILYDSRRRQAYLSANDHIDVFSLAAHNFSPPINVPSNGGTRQILGLALTPDGSKLLAANFSDLSVAIVDPDNPSSGAVAVPLPLGGLPYNPGPFQVATTSTNQAFVTTTVGNAATGGSSDIYIIDLSTFAVTVANLPVGSSLTINNNYLQGSTDGTVVFEATSTISSGPSLSWRAVDRKWQVHLVQGQFWSDAAVSGDGSVLAVSSEPEISNFPFPYLMDESLHITAQANFPEFEAIAVGPSLQLDQTGALLYGVTGVGVDLIDARTGQLRERILLSEHIGGGTTDYLHTPSKTIAVTPDGSQVFAITSAGLTAVQLDAVPISIGSLSPASGPAGTTVRLRGTGFTAGTSVTVGGIQATSSLLDSSTLSVTIPTSAPQGAVQFVLTNPDNSRFVLDAAFVVE